MNSIERERIRSDVRHEEAQAIRHAEQVGEERGEKRADARWLTVLADKDAKIAEKDAERARLMSELKYQLDTQSKINYARQEGKKEGKKEGIKTGEKNIIDLLKSGKTPEEIIKKFEN